MVPAAVAGSENRHQGPLLTPQGEGASLFLVWGEGRGVSRSCARGMAWVVSPLLDRVVCRRHA